MTIENLEARLKRMQPAFEQANDNPVPDGDYQTLLHEFDFFEGGTPTQAYLKIVFQIVHDAAHSGRRLESVFSLEDPDRLIYLKKALGKLGADMATFQLADCVPGTEFLNSLLDTPVLIRVKTGSKINPKTGDPYVGVYIEQRLGDAPQHSARDLAKRDEQWQNDSHGKHPEPPSRREDLPEKTGKSDVPGAVPGEFEHAAQAEEDAPWSSGDLDEKMVEALRAKGCVCENPAEAVTNPGSGHVDCPLPGHAGF